MPRPRRMQTPASSDRAIVRPTTRTYECPCGCGRRMADPNGCLSTESASGIVLLPNQISLAGQVAGDVDAMWLAEAQQLFSSPESVVDYGTRITAAQRLTWRSVMAQVDGEMRSLMELAEAQEWPAPEIDGPKIKWTNPEGGSISTPTRVVGRGFNNVKTQLRRLGLDIPNPQKKKDAQVCPSCADPRPDLSPGSVCPSCGHVEPADSENPGVAGEETGDPAIDPFAALGVLTAFVQDHTTDKPDEWVALCEELDTKVRDQEAQIAELESQLDSIRTALTTTAPWKALPTIAALLGIEEEKTA